MSDAPTVVRFPKETAGEPVPAVDRIGGMDVLSRPAGGGRSDVLLVAVGALGATCVAAADLLAGRGIGVTVVDPRWVKPVDAALPGLAAEHRMVAVVEDNGRAGGVGSAVAQALRDAGVDVPLRDFGIPQQFLAHAKRGEVLADLGLTPAEIAGGIGAALTRITARQGEPAVPGPAGPDGPAHTSLGAGRQHDPRTQGAGER